VTRSFWLDQFGDGALPPELRPYIGSILADRAQQRVRTSPSRTARFSEPLSPREHSVLRSMSSGLSNKRIAKELQIGPETVKSSGAALSHGTAPMVESTV
jgi:LuxR family transcriptional regulator, maltose regulon positive regulatory protein